MKLITIERIIYSLAAIFCLVMMLITGARDLLAQEVAYCKHGQTGEVIVIEANYACPYGYYRI